jgi:hypothetical protein
VGENLSERGKKAGKRRARDVVTQLLAVKGVDIEAPIDTVSEYRKKNVRKRLRRCVTLIIISVTTRWVYFILIA